MIKQILVIFLWSITSSLVLGQSRNVGYFGNKLFVSVEVSPIAYKYLQPRFKEYLLEDQNFLRLQGKLVLGWQKKIDKQWMFGVSYSKLPHIGMNSITSTFGGEIYAKIEKDYGFIAESRNIQYFFSFKKYKNIAPYGLFFGIKGGVNTVNYTYQHTYIERFNNTNNNTTESTTTIYQPKNGYLIYPVLGYHLGYSFLLSRKVTIDLGIRLNLLLSKRKIYINNEMDASGDIVNNIYRINRSSLSSSQILELHASFALYY